MGPHGKPKLECGRREARGHPAFRRAAQDGRLAGEPEWRIAVGRLLAASMAIVAILLDPTQPAGVVQEAQGVLGVYCSVSLLLFLFPLWRRSNDRAPIVLHLLDAGILGWLALRTGALASPFFPFLPFLLMAAYLGADRARNRRRITTPAPWPSAREQAGAMAVTAESIRAEERIRLARDLHDSVLQGLTAANLRLNSMARCVPDETRACLLEVAAVVGAQQRRLRRFVEDQEAADDPADVALRPFVSNHAETLCRQWTCRVAVEIRPPEAAVPNWLGREIVQIVSEATANAVRHGSATALDVLLSRGPTQLTMSIRDNGSGIVHPAARSPRSLSRRVARFGGRLAISRTGPGLGLEIILPCMAHP